ncbi:MAG: right-handed parallel beta-helix repeat-containing protein [candidate division Zixibacteria bacterium]|nr:right-handed parallel beta-helix repeat-containing protein [candidate division Zixibacteria bacterium]
MIKIVIYLFCFIPALLASGTAIPLTGGALFEGFSAGTIRYVDPAGSDETGDGSSSNPYATIQHAVNNSSDGDTVLVSPGTYHENIDITSREISIVSRYFITDDTSYITSTIIDGDAADVVFDFVTSSGVVSGFTIRNGYSGTGGGLHFYQCALETGDSLVVKHNIINDNLSCGIFTDGSELIIRNNIFINNTTWYAGGGVYSYNYDSSQIIYNVFIDNTAGTYGGAISCQAHANSIIRNNTIVGNVAPAGEGGGIYTCTYADPEIVNNIIVLNSGGGIYSFNHYYQKTLYNDVWGNTAGDDFINITPDVSNISCSPFFCDSANGDYSLMDISCCLGAGQSGEDIGAFGEGCTVSPGMVWYVNADNTGDFPTLQDAIDFASNGDTILAAQGTYYERLNFKGKEIVLASWYIYDSNEEHIENTILDGNYTVLGMADTGCVVHFINDEDTNSVLTGFTVKNGIGILHDATARKGGGIYSENASPRISHCLIMYNTCNYYGAGITSWYGSPIIEYCIFRNNTGSAGGAIACPEASPRISYCLIYNNEALSGPLGGGRGGGIADWSSGNPQIDHCTIYNNYAEIEGGGYDCREGNTNLTNCILWGNTPEQIHDEYSTLAVSYCDVEGGWGPGTGIIDCIPKFCEAGNRDFHLAANSCCIGAGEGGATPGAFGVGCSARNIVVRPGGSGDVPTIQDAVDYAGEGDTVLLESGIYTGDGNRDIDFAGKDIVLKSISGPGSTIIDCQGTQSVRHRVFYFHSGETSASRVMGVKITGGYAPLNGPLGTALAQGGGVLCDGASPIFENCVFYDNTGLFGGGAFCYDANPKFIDCDFNTNSATRGGAIYNQQASPEITGCVFTENSVLADYTEGLEATGGAVACRDNSSPVISGCTFDKNLAIGLSSYGAYGGAVDCYTGCSPVIFECDFDSNYVYGGSQALGAGLNCWGNSSPSVTGCSFFGNDASGDGGGVFIADYSSPAFTGCSLNQNVTDANGAAVSVYIHSSPSFHGCIFARNSAPSKVSGIYIRDTSYAAISNCTFSHNEGTGISLYKASNADIDKCIISFGTGKAVFWSVDPPIAGEEDNPVFVLRSRLDDEAQTESVTKTGGSPAAVSKMPFTMVVLSCCDIYGNTGGDWVDPIDFQAGERDNFAVDPLYCDTAADDFNIADLSLCAALNSSCGELVGALGVNCTDPEVISVIRPYPGEPVFLNPDPESPYRFYIQWIKGDAITAMDIELSKDGGDSWEVLATGLTGTEYEWRPTGEPSDQARLLIYESSQPARADTSRLFFIYEDPLEASDPNPEKVTMPVKPTGGIFDRTDKRFSEASDEIDLAILGFDGRIEIYRGHGDGTFDLLACDTLFGDSGAVDMEVFDLDKDGELDLLAANSLTNKLYLYFGNGDGTFMSNADDTLGLGSSPVDIGLADFDRDGNIDIWAACKSPGRVKILQGNGDATFDETPSAVSLNDEPQAGLTGYFNSDNVIDMAVATGASGTVAVYTGNGDGTFTLFSQTPTGGTIGGLAGSDFDADGADDIGVVFSDSSDALVLLMNDGAAYFSPVYYVTRAGVYSSAVAGDYTGDGWPDIVMTDSASRYVVMMPGIPQDVSKIPELLPGDPVCLGQPVYIEVGDNPVDLMQGDFDNDGLADVLVANFGSDDFMVLSGAIPVTVNTDLTLTYPNGGEELFLGNEYDITWTKGAGILAVNVQISHNDGDTWETIAANKTGSGFNWLASGAETEQALIRIFDPTVPSRTDLSDAVFTVAAGCCIGVTGNTDCSELEEPDISDITRLIDYLYISHNPLCCLEEADVNVSGGEPDISDITALIDNLYLSHKVLPDCP